jgi:hypothetical protein
LILGAKDLELDDVSSRRPLADMPVVRLDHCPGAIVRDSRAFTGNGTFLSVAPGELKTTVLVGNTLVNARKATEESATDYWSLLTPATPASASTAAAGSSGKWAANILTRQGGSNSVMFTFKVDGTKLAGTMATLSTGGAQAGGEREISEGKVSGSDISFVVTSQGRGGEQKTAYKGKMGNNEISFASQQVPPPGTDTSILGPPILFTATRAQ